MPSSGSVISEISMDEGFVWHACFFEGVRGPLEPLGKGNGVPRELGPYWFVCVSQT